MKYSVLAKTLWALETRFRNMPTVVPASLSKLVQGNDCIHYALDDSQVMAGGTFIDLDCRLVITVGANYADGSAQLPTKSRTGCISGLPFIEDDLSRNPPCRTFLNRFFTPPEQKSRVSAWKGKLTRPFDTYSLKGVTGDFHLVMMNLVPWITQDPWSEIRKNNPSGMFSLLSLPPNGGTDVFEPFRAIVKALGAERHSVHWVGHGNSEVYGLFLNLMDWVVRPQGDRVWFTSNLGFPPDRFTLR